MTNREIPPDPEFVLASRDEDDDRTFVAAADGFCAMKIDGVWKAAVLPSPDELKDFFTIIQDDNEAMALFQEAKASLGV